MPQRCRRSWDRDAAAHDGLVHDAAALPSPVGEGVPTPLPWPPLPVVSSRWVSASQSAVSPGCSVSSPSGGVPSLARSARAHGGCTPTPTSHSDSTPDASPGMLLPLSEAVSVGQLLPWPNVAASALSRSPRSCVASAGGAQACPSTGGGCPCATPKRALPGGRRGSAEPLFGGGGSGGALVHCVTPSPPLVGRSMPGRAGSVAGVGAAAASAASASFAVSTTNASTPAGELAARATPSHIEPHTRRASALESAGVSSSLAMSVSVSPARNDGSSCPGGKPARSASLTSTW
mmetsp:Transcript_13870/g.36808  ORF Transcript_13870/g.36808 Transcript_13870/m.36808 type:complete len:291 (+) Transcript_13870:121-993(+)